MKKVLIILSTFAFSLPSFCQSTLDFTVPETFTSVTKSCGSCNGAVSSSSQIGMRCPHCGVRWGYENTTHRSGVSQSRRNIPSSGIAMTSAKTNVRYGPSTDYPIVATLSANSIVTITGKSGNWVEVKFTETLGFEQTGYIRSDLLEF